MGLVKVLVKQFIIALLIFDWSVFWPECHPAGLHKYGFTSKLGQVFLDNFAGGTACVFVKEYIEEALRNAEKKPKQKNKQTIHEKNLLNLEPNELDC